MEKRKLNSSLSTSNLPNIHHKKSITATYLGFPSVSSSNKILAIANKSANCSPAPCNLRKRPEKVKQKTIAYSKWDYFSANQEPKKQSIASQIHKLRINFKNPHIYAGNTNIEDEQRKVEIRIFKAFQSIQGVKHF